MLVVLGLLILITRNKAYKAQVLLFSDMFYAFMAFLSKNHLHLKQLRNTQNHTLAVI